MLRSLYSGVSGLRNHQVKMDVIGNNIANVNTYGFKYGRALFQDIFSQNVRAASGPGQTLGGTNPAQVGLGISVAAIDTVHTNGGVATTEKPLDFMLDGEGFFVTRKGTELFYTRAGNFYQDADGNLLDAMGKHIQGFMGPVIDTQTGEEADLGAENDAEGVSVASYFKGLDGKPLGDWPASDFVDTDKLADKWNDPTTFSPVSAPDGAQPYPTNALQNITIPRCFTDIKIDVDGTVSARFNGDDKTYKIATVVISKFVNPEGLQKVGNNNYKSTLNSGAASFDRPASIGYGELRNGALEMSNVDLARETTEMIITQRGFQANSRIITISDSLLEELVNLKR